MARVGARARKRGPGQRHWSEGQLQRGDMYLCAPLAMSPAKNKKNKNEKTPDNEDAVAAAAGKCSAQKRFNSIIIIYSSLFTKGSNKTNNK